MRTHRAWTIEGENAMKIRSTWGATAAGAMGALVLSLGVLPAQAAQAAQAAKSGRVISPAKVNALMTSAKLKVQSMQRRGDTYVVNAKGLSGNEVVVVVDGRKGDIIGLDVVKWAPGAKRIKRGSRGKAFTGDVYEFGVTLTVAALVGWTLYDSRSWASTGVDWIEVTYEPVTFTEVTYETTVIEESYEVYTEEYSESYGVELEETITSYEETETSIEESIETEELMEEDGSEQDDAMEATSSENDAADEDEGDQDGDSSDEDVDDPDQKAFRSLTV
jgi:hypothetical protein